MLKTRVTSQLLIGGTLLMAVHLPSNGQDKGAAFPPAVPPLIILAPTEVRTDPTLARGCWVRLFPERGYKGTDDLTIAGPLSIASLRSPTGGAGGVYWKQNAESVIVGPKARVTVYENTSLRGPSAELQPGTEEPQLRNRLKSAQSIDSLKIECFPS